MWVIKGAVLLFICFPRPSSYHPSSLQLAETNDQHLDALHSKRTLRNVCIFL